MSYFILLETTIDNGLTKPSSIGTFFDGILMLAIFLFVVFLAYYSTKLISRAKGGVRKGSNLTLIEAIGVGLQGTIQLVKAGEKVFLIGVTKDKISLIAEIDPAELIQKDSSAETLAFGNLPKTFEHYLNKHFRKNNDELEQDPEQKPEIK